MNDDANERQRVSARIGEAVMDFCRSRAEFHADELRQYVDHHAGRTAPGSADRILRQLRGKGRLDYVVTSRRESRYQVRWAELALQ